MQGVNYANPTDIWWPHPSALDDLTVEETEDGFTLSAPDDTECAAWLAYFDETDERREVFSVALTDLLLKKANETLNAHGETQAVPNEQSGSGEQAKEVGAGALS